MTTPLTSFQKENQVKKKVGGYVYIEGDIDPISFETALRQVIQEHDALRITCDGSTQIFEKEKPFSLPIQEFSTSHQALAWITQEFAAPFPPATLFQFALCRIPGEGNYWLTKSHPLIADEQSVLKVVEHVADHYNALSLGQTLHPSLSSYAKWAEEEQNYCHSAHYLRDKQYWEHYTWSDPSLFQRSLSDQDHQVTAYSTPAFFSQLQAFSTIHQCSPLHVMLGILYSYFTFVTQREELVMGFAYRQPSPCLGPLTTILSVRFHYGTSLSFIELVHQIAQHLQEVTQHTRIAFTELAPIQSDIEFSFLNSSRKIRFAGAPATFTSLSDPQSLFSVSQSLDQVQFVYSLKAFNLTEIEWFTPRLEGLLEAITQSPERPLSQLHYLPQVERHKLLDEFNDTTTTYPSHLGIHQLFEEQVECTPEAIALLFKEQSVTYQELNRKANRLAHYLRTLGVKTETLVGICMERSVEMIVGLLGILKAGGAYLPLDPEHPAHRLNFMLADAQVKILLTQEKWAEKFPTLKGIICLDTPWEEVLHLSEANPVSQSATQALAYVCYTSGSTGQPKGVCVVHQSVVRLVKNTNYVQFTPEQIFLQVAPLAFDASTFEIWGSLLNGAKLVIMPPNIPALSELGETIHRHQVTIIFLTTGLFNLMVDEQLNQLSSVRQLLTGGEVASISRLHKAWESLCACQLIHVYGPTENTTYSTYFPITQKPLDLIPIGRPIANTQAYVLGKALQLMPLGVAGELYLGGDGLARGYLNRPELTAEKFIDHPFIPGARLYKTGDLARWLPDGQLEFLGRIDHQIKIRGFRVELGEIETAILQHPEIQEAIVIPQVDQGGDKRLIAYLTLKQHKLDPETYLALWQSIYHQTYSQVPQEETFNIIGWNSSYTRQPLPKEEMQEWVEQTVARIMALTPQNVLEIGCGTGLLLSHIAPHCQTYVGTDFSPLAIEHVRKLQNLAGGKLDHVQLWQRFADDFSSLATHSFDTVVLNSVLQHFPDVDYLLRVLQGAIQMIKPGGHLLIGDIRNLAMLETYYTSVHAYQATEDVTCNQLRRRIQQHLVQEEELLLSPSFFLMLKQHFPEITHIQVQPKRGRSHNELTRFRYEAILHLYDPVELATDITWIEWSGHSLSAILDQLQAHPKQIVGIRQIPNARLHEEFYTIQWLNQARDDDRVVQLRSFLSQQPRLGIEPDDFWDLVQELAYHIEISWLTPHPQGHYDVVLTPSSRPWKPALFTEKTLGQTWYDVANDPLQEHQHLIPQLRAFLKDKLPDYMLPKAFVVLEKMPLNQNGKVDRKALVALPVALESEEQFVAPRNEIEQTLANFWGEVLGIGRVGVHDDFFELGGNSLKGMFLFHKLQKQFTHRSFQLVDLFTAPTVAQFARSHLINVSPQRELGEI